MGLHLFLVQFHGFSHRFEFGDDFVFDDRICAVGDIADDLFMPQGDGFLGLVLQARLLKFCPVSRSGACTHA
jgi:hypothetical protein